MRVVHFFVAILFVLVGCFFYDDGLLSCEDSDDFIVVSVISPTYIDSVNIFADGELLYHRSYNALYLKENRGQYYYSYLSNDSTIPKSCLQVFCDTLRVLGCRIRFEGGQKAVNLQIYQSKIETEIDVKKIMNEGGVYINIIPEQDSTVWFSYTYNPTIYSVENFNSPATSTRLGCFNEYCFASLPMLKRQFCKEE